MRSAKWLPVSIWNYLSSLPQIRYVNEKIVIFLLKFRQWKKEYAVINVSRANKWIFNVANDDFRR